MLLGSITEGEDYRAKIEELIVKPFVYMLRKVFPREKGEYDEAW